MAAKYTNGSGVPKTKGLFFEYTTPEMRAKAEVPFTLSEEDKERNGKVYRSLYQLYMSYDDLTEYTFAKEVLGSYPAWKKLKRSYIFKPYYAAWREELELKLQAKGIASIINNSDKLQAAKWLAERGWNAPEKVGRTTKAKIQQEAAALANVAQDLDEFLDHAENLPH